MNRLSSSWTELMVTLGNQNEGIIFHTFNGMNIILDSIIGKLKTIEQISKEKGAVGTIDALGHIEDDWKKEIKKMRDSGKSRKEIETFLNTKKEEATGNWSKQEAERKRKIVELEKANKVGDGETMFGIKMSSFKTKKKLAGKDEEYARLLEQSERHKMLMGGISPLTDKLISSLFAPKNTTETGKTKKQGAGGLTLNESKNGSTVITFNIDTFQKNEFSKDGTNINNNMVKDFLDQMARGLGVVLNDAAIIAKQ
jgi:hypothetical protein